LTDGEELERYKTNPNVSDSDGDGLGDRVEVIVLDTNPSLQDTNGDGIIDGDEDSDSDKLSDADEINIYNTNPKIVDSDLDGLSDGDEVFIHKTKPNVADSDGDGLSDGEEVTEHGTNPLLGDTDEDGLTDSEELERHRTDPNVADTDGDGLGDGGEIYDYNTDPLLKDSDEDGLLDGQEVNEYKTSALEPDTDGDGLTDSEELERHRTDPNVADTDGDGLGDGEEVEEHETNPLLGDSDRDGSLDFIEVRAGTDPNNPFEYPTSGYNHVIGETNLKRPIITVPPHDEGIALGGTVLFKVEARNGSLTYRWIKLGEGVVGANRNVLRIDNVGHDDIGFYVVLVSNKFGSIYSKTVKLDLILEFSKPRLDIILTDGKTMTIEISGTSFHTYKIQDSRDLKEWRSLDYNLLKTNDQGKTRLELNLFPESEHIFFRLVD
jgi:hypothetical protein